MENLSLARRNEAISNQRGRVIVPEAFAEYFGQYGLDITETRRTTGFLTFNGDKLNSTANLANTNPKMWSTNEERKLINAYLPLRFKTSMTHSKMRAQKIKGFLDRGALSEERHSFV
ncbi:MAG: hypothetical protein DHS20C18_26110 [Saprospiraceae bacterium]|nr:MAG: hypothetical protein DHS20C18_26110 [Saprospiraceae bacterium]